MQTEVEFAGLGRRFVALAIDLALFCAVAHLDSS